MVDNWFVRNEEAHDWFEDFYECNLTYLQIEKCCIKSAPGPASAIISCKLCTEQRRALKGDDITNTPRYTTLNI